MWREHFQLTNMKCCGWMCQIQWVDWRAKNNSAINKFKYLSDLWDTISIFHLNIIASNTVLNCLPTARAWLISVTTTIGFHLNIYWLQYYLLWLWCFKCCSNQTPSEKFNYNLLYNTLSPNPRPLLITITRQNVKPIVVSRHLSYAMKDCSPMDIIRTSTIIFIITTITFFLSFVWKFQYRHTRLTSSRPTFIVNVNIALTCQESIVLTRFGRYAQSITIIHYRASL